MTSQWTARDVIQKALDLYDSGDEAFDCPYCALGKAQTALQGDEPVSVTEFQQYLTGDVQEGPEDQPLVDATEMLRPFNAEIAGCPSAVSRARSMEMLREAAEMQQERST